MNFWEELSQESKYQGWKWSESESRSVVSDSLQPHGLHSPWNSPGQNTGMGSRSLLQGIFPTQGLKPGLPNCRHILNQLSHKGSHLCYTLKFYSHEIHHWKCHQLCSMILEWTLLFIFILPRFYHFFNRNTIVSPLYQDSCWDNVITTGKYHLLWHICITGEGNGNPLQYSCLENPMDRGVHGVTKSRTQLSD